MSTVELRADVFERLNALLDNDEALTQLSSYMQRLQKKLKSEKAEEDLRPYTMEELNARIDEAEADDAADRLVPHEEVMNNARKYVAML